ARGGAGRGLPSGGGVLGRRQRRADAQAVVFFGAGGQDRRGSATAGRRDTRGTQASRGASRRASRRTAGMKRLNSRTRRPTVEPRCEPQVGWQCEPQRVEREASLSEAGRGER